MMYILAIVISGKFKLMDIEDDLCYFAAFAPADQAECGSLKKYVILGHHAGVRIRLAETKEQQKRTEATMIMLRPGCTRALRSQIMGKGPQGGQSIDKWLKWSNGPRWTNGPKSTNG